MIGTDAVLRQSCSTVQGGAVLYQLNFELDLFQITVPSILIACGAIQIVVCAAMGYKMSCYMGRRGQNNFDVENSTTKLEPAGVSQIPPTY